MGVAIPLAADASDIFVTTAIAPVPGPGADLRNADLRNADLRGVNLTGALMSGAQLAGARLAGANLTGVVSGGIVGKPASLPQQWQFRSGYLLGPGANLSGANLRGINLTGMNLSYANLAQANLAQATLNGTALRGVRSGGITGVPASLPGGWTVAKGFLIGPTADLSGADLSGSNLRRANLSAANLTNANLANANVSGANLVRAQLNGIQSGGLQARVPVALPPGWRLTRGYLVGSGANLANASLQSANLRNLNLGTANLAGADLSGADLRSASFSGSLAGAILSGARIQGTNFSAANLTDIRSGGLVSGAPAALPPGWASDSGFLVGRTMALEDARRFVTRVSGEIGRTVKAINAAAEDQKPSLRAALAGQETRRYPALVRVVLAENPQAQEIDPVGRIFSVPVPGAATGTVNGSASVLVAWNAYNLSPINGQFMGMSRGLGPDPARIASNQSLAGSSNWSGFYPAPGDYDCSEQWDITTATDKATAAGWAADELIKFATYQQDSSGAPRFANFEFYRLGIKHTGGKAEFSRAELVDAGKPDSESGRAVRAEMISAIERLDKGRISLNFFALLNDGRLTHMQKVIGLSATDPATGAGFFESIIDTPELLDAGAHNDPSPDFFFRSQVISSAFQEIYVLGRPSGLDPEGLEEYAISMRRLALKEIGLKPDGTPDPTVTPDKIRILKSANRAFSYLRTIGDIEGMEKLQPIYQSPYLLMNQRMQMLDVLQDALGSFGTTIITAAKAREQVLGAANEVRPLDPNVAAELVRIASLFKGTGVDPADLSKPLRQNSDLEKDLGKAEDALSNAIDDAVERDFGLTSIVKTYVVPWTRADNPSSTWRGSGNGG